MPHLQYNTTKTNFSNKEVKTLHEEGGYFNQFLYDLLTNTQKDKVDEYLKLHPKFQKVYDKW